MPFHGSPSPQDTNTRLVSNFRFCSLARRLPTQSWGQTSPIWSLTSHGLTNKTSGLFLRVFSTPVIPYTGIYGPCPTENLVLHAKVTRLEDHSVIISRSFPEFGLSNVIDFDYCIYALGSILPAPIDIWHETEECSKENVDVLGEVDSDAESSSSESPINGKQRAKTGTKKEGVEWLKQAQKKIKSVDSVLVVGGGALGIRETPSLRKGI